LVVEGAGSWVETAYRPAFQKLAESQRVVVTYLGLEPTPPAWLIREPPTGTLTEFYLQAIDANRDRVKRDHPDAVFVVTPDTEHMNIAEQWVPFQGEAPSVGIIFVEKPFSDKMQTALDLKEKLERYLEYHPDDAPIIRGVDHYALPFFRVLSLGDRILNELPDDISKITFVMMETTMAEPERARTIRMGLTADMASHFFGILVGFSNVSPLSELQVKFAGQHRPLVHKVTETRLNSFDRETCSRLKFKVTLHDQFSLSGEELPVIECDCTVGKGQQATSKYVDIHSEDGTFLRIDLTRPGDLALPTGHGYPLRAIFAGRAESPDIELRTWDPHLANLGNEFALLGSIAIPEHAWNLYYSLVSSLFSADPDPLVFLLNIDEGVAVATAVEQCISALTDWQEQNAETIKAQNREDAMTADALSEARPTQWLRHPAGFTPEPLTNTGRRLRPSNHAGARQ
jgi:hypothetical protein